MTSVKKDQNSVSVITALSDSNQTVLMVYANPATHALVVDDGTSGSDLGYEQSVKDANGVNSLLGASNSDGLTPVPLYANSSTNGLKVNSH